MTNQVSYFDMLFWRVQDCLGQGRAMGALQLAEELDADLSEVQAVLHELADTGRVHRRRYQPCLDDYPQRG